MELKNLVDQPNKLPTVPKVVQQLIESFNSEDISAAEIAHLIASDPALAAKLLRLANSAYFHVSRTVGTVDDALRMLGFVMVRNLVLGNGMVAAFKNTKGMDLQQFWRYNLYTACAARWLAQKGGDNGDTAFTLGMMHGIGQLQLHAVAPAEVMPLDKEMNVLDAGRAALEKEKLGFHYADVSAELAKIWNFPESLSTALKDIPAPLASTPINKAAAWVHLGAWRARAEVLELSDEEMTEGYPTIIGKRLNVDAGWVPALVAHAKDRADRAMPPLNELTAGLDAMLE
ncbi:HDOD domain-containing protein [Herbaspirillum sp. RV1423]|uniref:HDOD domain-containing protein n=1 Tax=Herbaspirillum sp. RV1423 TaxID=1443993 RepID=UPI0004B935E2|nr:HDOD domain-containing protein [Herbaspirillum sp. RV1423]